MDLSNEKLAALRTGLKKMVIQECNVQDVAISQIGDEETVIGGEGALRLDSLDAVEIVSSIERSFGIKFENPGQTRVLFKSFSEMAKYVAGNSSADRLENFIKQQQNLQPCV